MLTRYAPVQFLAFGYGTQRLQLNLTYVEV